MRDDEEICTDDPAEVYEGKVYRRARGCKRMNKRLDNGVANGPCHPWLRYNPRSGSALPVGFDTTWNCYWSQCSVFTCVAGKAIGRMMTRSVVFELSLNDLVPTKGYDHPQDKLE
ncbi:uncharacterized protein BJX67DRAFT_346060 [Aspergillus lucknowensis]|uniref:Uncharacterized protein n=1 Tax=Aspergillus lucknowensis TaxID=176173 RepID=A0ABR4LZH9_9EURO